MLYRLFLPYADLRLRLERLKGLSLLPVAKTRDRIYFGKKTPATTGRRRFKIWVINYFQLGLSSAFPYFNGYLNLNPIPLKFVKLVISFFVQKFQIIRDKALKIFCFS